MEAVGVVLAVPAVVSQLLKVCIAGYDLFRGAQAAGSDIRDRLHDLDISKQIFEDWMSELARHNDNMDHIIQPKSKRYVLILETLAMVAGFFAEVEQLKDIYGITNQDNAPRSAVVEEETEVSVEEKSKRQRVLHKIRSCFRKLHLKETKPIHGRSKAGASLGISMEAAPVPLTYALVLPGASYNVPAVPSEAELGARVSNIDEVAKEMSLKATTYQEVISTWQSYEWSYTSGDKLTRLVNDLEKYVEHLTKLTKYPLERLEAMPALALPDPFYEFKVGKQLPYPPLSTFCGREDILREMEEFLAASIMRDTVCKRATIALKGMGGIGKSQITLEYIYRNPDLYSAVFWVDGTNQETLCESGRQVLQTLITHCSAKHRGEDSFINIAIDLGIPGQLDINGKLSNQVEKEPWTPIKRWLAREGNFGWCLIVDGLNVPEDVEAMKRLLPPCAHGHIIVTSRVHVDNCRLIEVQYLDRDSSLNLLLGGKANVKAAANKVKEAAATIAEKLGYLPLALSLATAYVVNFALDYVQYLGRLTENPARYIGEEFARYPEGLISCWQLSVKALMHAMPHSIDLLRLCSFLSPDGVSKELLCRGLSALEYFENDSSKMDRAIDKLVQYALMKRRSINAEGEQMYWIHPLVRHWAQETYFDGKSTVLETDAKRLLQLHADGALTAISLVGCSLKTRHDNRDASEWAFERQNMTHIALCLDTYIQEGVTTRSETQATIKVALALANFSGLKFYWGDFSAAAKIVKLSISLYEKLSPAHPSPGLKAEMYLAKQRLVHTYLRGNLSDFGEVEGIITGLLSQQSQLSALTDADCLWTQSLKASYLRVHGRFEEARDLFEQCMEKNRELLDPDHPVSMATITNLAGLCNATGDVKNAEKLYNQCKELYLEHRGLDHRDTQLMLSNIAWFMGCIRNSEGQLECLKLIAKGTEATYGLANETSIRALYQLRNWYENENQEDKAEAVTMRIEEAERVLGDAGTPTEWVERVERRAAARL